MLVLAIVCANFTSSIVPICICLLGLIAFIKKSKIILLFVLIYLLTYSFLFVVEKFNASSFTATEYSGNCQIIDNLKIDGDSFQAFVRCEKEKFQLSYKITTEEE